MSRKIKSHDGIYNSRSASASMQTAKIMKLAIRFHFPDVKVISKELTRKLEIINLWSNLPIILD